MTPDLRDLYTELDDLAPPLAVDAETMTTRGRRRVRIRRMRAYGGLAAFAAVVVGAAYVLGGLAHPAGPVQPSYNIPQLERAAYDYWTMSYDGSPTENEETRKLTEGEFRVLSAIPGLLLLGGMSLQNRPPTVDQIPQLWRGVNKLTVGGDPNQVAYVQPFYGSFAAPSSLKVLRESVPSPVKPDNAWAEVGVRVLPKGGYLGKDPEADPARALTALMWGPYTEPACADAETAGGAKYTYECSETTGPHGERVLRALQVVDDGPDSTLQQAVVVYQSNGNALTLMTTMIGIDGPDSQLDPGDVAHAKSFLTIDELTTAALAMPEVIVV